ncbi:NQR2, RnfD, RnfE family [Actinopolyspora mzabensis]|uniref:NQR2, RnfD, RnfE family n=1 Tax=Actinopolyspora mzabensis TaxID=995066 RepID=A0A1G8Y4S6_ACTMZ|nr:RnfABCDGE type electron transport complex subunit D [Actinopolyspora mzabensis]SDJ97733.1 NQR2, RnfD, RnfE family [Actinopolyspora mzabensis]
MATESQNSSRKSLKVITALRRFAISITVFNLLGYLFLGFEQPWLWPFIAILTAYAVEIFLELLAARAVKRAPQFSGNGVRGVVEFLYPAHITGLAVNMLIYVNDQVWAMMFGVTVAVGAKWLLRAPVNGRMRHFMNPSNLGIATILILFPWASIAPPYHFTESTGIWLDWFIPLVILVSGTMLNAKLTGKMWLIVGWVTVYALQSVLRGVFLDTSIAGALASMTGVAFILFTNYMVTDPATTPSKPASQLAFGSGVAVFYGLLTGASIAYGLFFATAGVCLIRGVFLWSVHFVNKSRERSTTGHSSEAGSGQVMTRVDAVPVKPGRAA